MPRSASLGSDIHGIAVHGRHGRDRTAPPLYLRPSAGARGRTGAPAPRTLQAAVRSGRARARLRGARPLWLVLGISIAVAIRLGDGGSVLYRQARLGRGGRIFAMLKFRTMAEDAGGSAQAEELVSNLSDSASSTSMRLGTATGSVDAVQLFTTGTKGRGLHADQYRTQSLPGWRSRHCRHQNARGKASRRNRHWYFRHSGDRGGYADHFIAVSRRHC